MASPERTQKWPDDFKDRESFLEYCMSIAKRLYKLLTWKDIDDD